MVKQFLRILAQYLAIVTFVSSTFSHTANAGWERQWMDPFDGSEVDFSNWTAQTQADYNNEDQCYTDDDSSADKNYEISGGTLKIIARRQAGSSACASLGNADGTWTSGRLNSKDKREFLYGRIESRIRMHNLEGGTWPAFWMLEGRINEQPVKGDGDNIPWNGPGAGEIDVWEWFSNRPDSYITNFFNANLSECGDEELYPYPGGGNDVLQWHDYAIEWTPDTIHFFVDDIEVVSYNVTSCAQYKEPMFVLINLAIGGTLGGMNGGVDPTLFLATLEIDYVAHCTATTSNTNTRCNESTPTATVSAPVITSTAVTSATLDTDYSYILTATDTQLDTLTLTAPVLPAWLSFDSSNGLLFGTPSSDDIGDHNVSLVVDDGNETVTQEFVISVLAVANGAPTITSSASRYINQGQEYRYTLEATDPEGDPLTTSSVTIPEWLTFENEAALLSGTPGADDVGSHKITLTVSDGTNTTNYDFTVVVLKIDAVDDTESDEGSSGGGGGSFSWYLLGLLGCWTGIWRRHRLRRDRNKNPRPAS